MQACEPMCACNCSYVCLCTYLATVCIYGFLERQWVMGRVSFLPRSSTPCKKHKQLKRIYKPQTPQLSYSPLTFILMPAARAADSSCNIDCMTAARSASFFTIGMATTCDRFATCNLICHACRFAACRSAASYHMSHNSHAS